MAPDSFTVGAQALRSGHVLRLLTRRLFHPVGDGVLPDLARTIPTVHNGGISADLRTYRICLRPGVFWDAQQPRQVTAGDVVRGLKRIAHPTAAHARGYLTETIEGMRAYCAAYDAAFADGGATAPDLAQFQLAAVPGIRAVDASTLELRVPRPAPDLLHILATGIAAAAPREYDYYRPDSHEMQRNAPSAGPLRVAAGSRSSRHHPPATSVVLEPNPSWDPHTDPVERAVDAAADGPPYGLLYLAVNERRGVPPALRRAIALGVDRLAVRDASGATEVQHGLILPGGLGCGGVRVAPDTGDPDRARDLAGEHSGVNLIVEDSPTQRRIAECLTTALAKCGIAVRARELRTGEASAGEASPDDWDLALHTWSPAWLGVNGRTAIAPLVCTEGAANHGDYRDRVVDSLVADALREPDPVRASGLWRQVELKVLADLPLVPLAAWTDPDRIADAYPTVSWTAPAA